MAAVLAIFGFLLATAFYTLPSNVISLDTPGGAREVFNLLATQNFAYFTKDPQEATQFAYSVRASGDLSSLLVTPQNRPNNLFGLSRTQRAQGPEIATLMNNPDVPWVKCGVADAPDKCLAASAATATQTQLTNSSPVPTVCGDTVLALEVPVEWSFKDLVPDSFRVVQSARVDVRCIR